MPPRPTPTPRLALGEDGKLKPPPPPFNREYIGHFGPGQTQVVAFRKKGAERGSKEIDVAFVGTVIDGIFIVREIGLESVVIGFVGAAESKAELHANPRGIPYATVLGRRGGSAMAAGAFNALFARQRQ